MALISIPTTTTSFSSSSSSAIASSNSSFVSLCTLFKHVTCPPPPSSRPVSVSSFPVSIECSSRPRKKCTAHHNKTRPKKHNPSDKNRKPTVYPKPPKAPPAFTWGWGDEAEEGTTSTSSAPTVGMEAADEEVEVWSRVPDDVVERVWKNLTAYDCIRLGCTCKRFKSLLLFSKSPMTYPCRPNLVLVPSREILFAPTFEGDDDEEEAASQDHGGWVCHRLSRSRAYEPTLLKMLPLSLSFLAPHVSLTSYPVASAGGLLCFTSLHGTAFVICNPLTKSWSQLPPHISLARKALTHDGRGDILSSFPIDSDEEDSVHAFGMIAFNHDHGMNPHGYELFVINYTSRSGACTAMAYSSNLHQWQVISTLTMDQPYCTLISMSIVVMGRNAEVDHTTTELYSLWKRRSEFIVYHLAGGRWLEIECPDYESSLISAHLIDCYGVLHMIGCVGTVWLPSNVIERPTSVRIWRLDPLNKRWSEVRRMPGTVLHEFRRNIDIDTLHCVGKDGVIYFTSRLEEILMHDIDCGEWRWFDAEALEVDEGPIGLILEPSLISP